MNLLDRFITWLSPGWGKSRVQSRLMVRHFEAASVGRRTDGWSRRLTDANSAASGATLANLRAQARDLVRNNPWARRGLRRLTIGTVGWGIRPKAAGSDAPKVTALWKRWGETTECDAAGRLTFYGLQRLVMRTVVESGEVLIRLRRRKLTDGLAIPIQLQVLEPDYIDTGKDNLRTDAGGHIIQGIEFDAIGRRVAYWLFDEHPGGRGMPVSRRVPADSILHVFDQDRPGQVRGTSWFASVDVRLHEFDEFEDATLMKQKIASCMAAFVTDLDGSGPSLGKDGVDRTTGLPTDSFEPGMILNLPAGKSVTVANPPQATDHQSFSASALRGVAAGLGVTYEDLCGDYSQVNYSSARMARLAFTADVYEWRENIMIAQFCAPVWRWMLETLAIAGEVAEVLPARWTPPPAQMLDPDKEGAAYQRLVRAGVMTRDQVVREQGYDPDEFWQEYADGNKRLDDLEIILDSDPRKTTGAGQLQLAAKSEPPTETDEADDDAEDGDDGREYESFTIVYEMVQHERDRSAAAEKLAHEERVRCDARVVELREKANAEMDRMEESCKAAIAAERDFLAAALTDTRAENDRAMAAQKAVLEAERARAVAELDAEHARRLAERDVANAAANARILVLEAAAALEKPGGDSADA